MEYFLIATFILISYILIFNSRNLMDYEQIINWLLVAKEPKSKELATKEERYLGLKLILEELSELAEAYGKESSEDFINLLDSAKKSMEEKINNIPVEPNKEGIVDAIVDLVVVTHNNTFFNNLKEDYQEHFSKVMGSNWSKYDDSEDNAKITKASYEKKGIETYYREREVDGEIFYVTYRASDSKILKSWKFKDPNEKR